MKKYKGLFVPPLDKEIEEIREAYCNLASECTLDPDCNDCIFAKQNLKQFIEWYNKKKK